MSLTRKETEMIASLCLPTTQDDPSRRPDSEFIYVDVSAVSNEIWKIVSPTKQIGATAPSRARKLVRSGDVIFATIRPTLRRVAIVPEELDGATASTAFCVLRPDPERCDSRFLFFSLLTSQFAARMAAIERGASYPAVSDSDVFSQELLVPPLQEQVAIGRSLETLLKAVEIENQRVKLLRDLKAATMAKLFREGLRGEPSADSQIGVFPSSWKVARCEDLCTRISVGIVVTPARYYAPAGTPCFRSFNVREDQLVPRDLVFISEHAHALHAKSELRTGDVIVVRSGNPGTACVVPESFDRANCVDLLFARPDASKILPDYLARFINSSLGRQQVARAKAGLAQKHLNVSALRQMLIAVPSADEQREISYVGRCLDRRIGVTEGVVTTMRHTFESALAAFMTGRLRTNSAF